MSSNRGAVRGAARPRLRTVPRYVTSAGSDAVELAAACGVILDDWQAWILEQALGERADGTWSAFEVGVCVPRQNGKGEVILARELAGLLLFGERLIMHSAHEYKTAAEGFMRIQSVFENNDWLRKQVKTIRTSHGEEGITLKNGNRLRFVARSKGSGRGFTADCLLFDEAMYLDARPVAAMLPTLSSRPNPQVWYLGSAGTEESAQFAHVRERAVEGKTDRLCYLEWSAPHGADPMETANLAMANPALGIRIPLEFVESERDAMPETEYARERMGIWTNAKADSVIDPMAWAGRCDPRSQIDGAVVFALSASQNRQWWTITAAGTRKDGAKHVEVIATLRGSAGVQAKLDDLTTKWFNNGVVVDPAGVAGSLIPSLEQAGIEVIKPTKREVAAACGLFADTVAQDGLYHLGQPILDTAVLAGTKRQVGDVWVWDERTDTDVSALTGASLALHGVLTEPEYDVLDSIY